MQTFSFHISFRFDFTDERETDFSVELTDAQIAFVKQYLKENGDMPFWAMEFDNPELFALMLKAQSAAIVKVVNEQIIEPGETPFTEESINWEYVPIDFYWPDFFFES